MVDGLNWLDWISTNCVYVIQNLSYWNYHQIQIVIYWWRKGDLFMDSASNEFRISIQDSKTELKTESLVELNPKTYFKWWQCKYGWSQSKSRPTGRRNLGVKKTTLSWVFSSSVYFWSRAYCAGCESGDVKTLLPFTTSSDLFTERRIAARLTLWSNFCWILDWPQHQHPVWFYCKFLRKIPHLIMKEKSVWLEDDQ